MNNTIIKNQPSLVGVTNGRVVLQDTKIQDTEELLNNIVVSESEISIIGTHFTNMTSSLNTSNIIYSTNSIVQQTNSSYSNSNILYLTGILSTINLNVNQIF